MDETERLRELLEERTQLLEKAAQREKEVHALNERSVALLNERAKIIEDLERHNKGTSALLSVAKATSESLDIEQVINSGLEKLLDAVGLECGCIYLPEDGKLVLKAQREFTPEMVEEISSIETGENLTGNIFETGKPIVIDDIAADSRHTSLSPGKAGYQAYAGIPLILKEKAIGVIAITTRLKHHFSEEEIQLLSAIAGQLATAIGNAELFQQTKEDEEELAFITTISRIFSSALDLSKKYETAIKELRKSIDADWSTLAFIEGDSLYFQSLSSRVGSAWQEGETVPLKGSASEWVAENKVALIEDDLAEKRMFYTGEQHLKRGIRSITYLPLLSGGEVFGIIILGSRRPRAYGKREKEWLEYFAYQSAPIIENARAFAELKEATGELAFITELSRIITSGLDVDKMFDKFITEVRKTIDADCSSLVFIEGNELYYAALSAGTEPFREAGIRVPLKGTTTEWVAQHKEALVQNDLLQEEERFPSGSSYVKMGLKSIIHVPLTFREEVIGCLIVGSQRPGAYGKKEIEWLNHLVWQLTPAIEMAKALDELALEKENLEQAHEAVIDVLIRAGESHEPFGEGHSVRVGSLSKRLALYMGLSESKARTVETAAKLHDIGKVAVPNNILLKRSEKRTKEEEAKFREHVTKAVEFISSFPQLKEIIPYVEAHHERYDGTGYPKGLKGKEVPLEANILRVADAYDVLVGERPWRAPLSQEEALGIIRKGAGTRWDPRVVDSFLTLLSRPHG